MAKFIEFNVVGNGTAWENGKQFIGINDIIGAVQVAPANVKIFTDNAREVTLTLSIDPTGFSAPTLTDGRVVEAIGNALTANPGGVKVEVLLPKDDNGAQLYINDITIA